MDNNNVVLIGGCKDENERNQRNKEKEDFFECLKGHKGYWEVSLVLDNSYMLFREALNDYSTCAYMSTVILCRFVVESAIYILAISENLE